MLHRKLVCEKIGEFLTTSSIGHFLEHESVVLKVLCINIIHKVCAAIKENHTDKEIAEKLDMDLVKSCHINYALIPTARQSDKLGQQLN